MLRQRVFSFGLLATDVAAPDKVAREVDGLDVVLHVHLPSVAEAATRALVAGLYTVDVLEQVLVTVDERRVEACTESPSERQRTSVDLRQQNQLRNLFIVA